MSDGGHPPILDRLGQEIRRRRLALALTLRELAEQAGVSQRFLISVEKGRANISVVRLSEIAAALGTSAATLLAPERERVAQPSSALRRTVALLGLRGAGKSTVGSRAAERLGVDHVELDGRVVERAGMTLASIFELHGGDYYRRLEGEVLEDLLETGPPCMVATGGGIVTNHATFERLRRDTVTVWLSATAEDHWNRVVAQGDVRPMANREDAMTELRSILRARRALYERAAHVIDTSALGLDRSVDALVKIAREAD